MKLQSTENLKSIFLVLVFFAAVIALSELTGWSRTWIMGVFVVGVLVVFVVGMVARVHRDKPAQRRWISICSGIKPRGDAWRRLVEALDLTKYVVVLAPHVRPALRIETSPVDSLPLGASRIGGRPDLPLDEPWPVHDTPLAFVAQLDLAEVGRALPGSPLPSKGHLWFFQSFESWSQGPQHAARGAVLYRPAGTALATREFPADLNLKARFRLCAVRYEMYEDIPDCDNDALFEWIPGIPNEMRRELSEEEGLIAIQDYLASGYPGGDGCHSHKLLGYPMKIQGSGDELAFQLGVEGLSWEDYGNGKHPRAKEIQQAARDWRFLLQVASDRQAAMMWGDAGTVYYWIRDQDLRQRRFDSARTTIECH